MINYKLLNSVKLGTLILGFIGIFVFGFVLGDGLRAKSITSQVVASEVATSTQKSGDEKPKVTYDEVKEFLIAFYTKVDLEENQNRYKPFMTEGLYNATVAEEKKAANQAYKGYVVDQTLEKSEIYIDETTNTVVVLATYKHKVLAVKNNRSKFTEKTGTDKIRLAYSVVNGKLLVNSVEQLVFEKAKTQTGLYRQ